MLVLCAGVYRKVTHHGLPVCSARREYLLQPIKLHLVVGLGARSRLIRVGTVWDRIAPRDRVGRVLLVEMLDQGVVGDLIDAA